MPTLNRAVELAHTIVKSVFWFIGVVVTDVVVPGANEPESNPLVPVILQLGGAFAI